MSRGLPCRYVADDIQSFLARRGGNSCRRGDLQFRIAVGFRFCNLYRKFPNAGLDLFGVVVTMRAAQVLGVTGEDFGERIGWWILRQGLEQTRKQDVGFGELFLSADTAGDIELASEEPAKSLPGGESPNLGPACGRRVFPASA